MKSTIPSIPKSPGFLATLLFLSCPSGLEAQSGTLERMREEVEELRVEVEALEADAQAVVTAAENIELARQETEVLKSSFAAREKALAERFFLLDAYRSAYRVTHSIPVGQPMPTFVLRDGRSVSGGVFQGVERGGVKIATPSGISVIAAELLPSTLSGEFKLPAAVPAPSGTLEELLARKPEEFREATELAGAAGQGDGAAAGQGDGAAAAPGAVAAAPPTEAGGASPTAAPAGGDRLSEIQAKEQRNRERWAEIDILRAEVNNYFFTRRDIERAKDEKRREFEQRRIRADPRAVAEALKVFDDQLKQLEAEEQGKMKQIRELQRDLE